MASIHARLKPNHDAVISGAIQRGLGTTKTDVIHAALEEFGERHKIPGVRVLCTA